MCLALEYRGYRLGWPLPDQLVLFRTFEFAKRYIMEYIPWYESHMLPLSAFTQADITLFGPRLSKFALWDRGGDWKWVAGENDIALFL